MKTLTLITLLCLLQTGTLSTKYTVEHHIFTNIKATVAKDLDISNPNRLIPLRFSKAYVDREVVLQAPTQQTTDEDVVSVSSPREHLSFHQNPSFLLDDSSESTDEGSNRSEARVSDTSTDTPYDIVGRFDWATLKKDGVSTHSGSVSNPGQKGDPSPTSEPGSEVGLLSPQLSPQSSPNSPPKTPSQSRLEGLGIENDPLDLDESMSEDRYRQFVDQDEDKFQNLTSEQTSRLREIDRRNEFAFLQFNNSHLTGQLRQNQKFLFTFSGSGWDLGLLSREDLTGSLLSDFWVQYDSKKLSFSSWMKSYRFTERHNDQFMLKLRKFLKRDDHVEANIEKYNGKLNSKQTAIEIVLDDWFVQMQREKYETLQRNGKEADMRLLNEMVQVPCKRNGQGEVVCLKRKVPATVLFFLKDAVVINDFKNTQDGQPEDTTQSLLFDEQRTEPSYIEPSSTTGGTGLDSRRLSLNEWKKSLVRKIEEQIEDFAVSNRFGAFSKDLGVKGSSKQKIIL